MSKRPRDGRPADADPHPDTRKTRPAKGAPEDFSLWHYTTRTISPLRKAKARVPEVGALPEPQTKPRPPTSKPNTPPPPQPQRKNAKTPATPIARPAPPKAPPPLVPIERRTARRIARGLVEIDARIDLHGLRQADAERRLRAFLIDARSRGLRTVLVITGKGGPKSASGVADDADDRPRGVLRRSVPMWLEQPDLRDCVAGMAQAHVRHGGDGALYIHLRKPRGRT